MSSKLMPAKFFCNNFTVLINVSASLVSTTNGIQSTSPNFLNNKDLPSITGNAAAAPISPRPSTRVPSDTTATMLERQVNSKDSASLSLIRKHGSATPGV